MKARIILLALLYLIVYNKNIAAQESRFYVKLKSAAMQFAPDLIEERVQQQQDGNCRTEKFILYRKKEEILDSAIWKICVSGIEVEVLKNDAPYHQFKLEESEQEGRISQVKGKLLVKAIRDTLTNKIQVWEIGDKFDQRYRIVYNPEAKRIESQFEPFSQRHALQNFMFQDIPLEFMPLSNPAATLNELKAGDAMQIVYHEKNDTGSIPRQINDYLILERDVRPEFPVTRIAFTTTDLVTGVTLNNDTVEVQELPDGLFIGNNLAIPYSAYTSGFYYVNPAEGEWRCYMLPREDFVNPLLELVYQEQQQLHGIPTDFLYYWNSELPYRISWIRNFPLPFQEYEKLVARIAYIKRGGIESGSKFQNGIFLKTGIRYFDETADGMNLTIFVSAKGSYSIELVDGTNQTISTIPASVNLKPGMQKLQLKCSGKQAARYYKVILKQVISDKSVTLQEFVFLSRYF